MSFEFEKFCREHSIATAPGGHKHRRPGWVQVECPFCTGNPGYHLGYNIQNDYFNCWRCGHKSVSDVIMRFLDCSYRDAQRELKMFKGRPRFKKDKEDLRPKLRSACKWPPDCGPLKKQHKQYLKSRDFDPDVLEERYQLRGTGYLGNYKFRIIAPIFFEHKMVSYQGRDITERSALPYKACAQADEARDHKHCLYGAELVPGSDVVIVEGIVDAWRLGPGAVATFGIEHTQAQLNLLRKYRRRFVYYDSADVQAMEQAEKLAAALSAFRGEVEIIETEWEDPGEMPQEEANELMKELIG